MAGKIISCSLCFFLVFATALNLDLINADAESEILSNFQQTRNGHDARPRLSASQQAQILSDVQQHQQRFANGPSLAKYKVDRGKQQQIQQLLQQQQQIQRLIQEQQRKIAQQLENPRYFDRFEALSLDTNQFQQQQHVDNVGNVRNLYLEKQRELQELQKQRQQLLRQQSEQQLLKRQQDALKQLSTTATSTASFRTTTLRPVLVSLPTARKITPSESELFLKAIATHQKKFTNTATTPVLPTVGKTSQKTTTEKISPPTTEITTVKAKQPPRVHASTLNSDRDQLLLQLKQALSRSIDSDTRNVSTRDILLATGGKIQLINSEAPFSSSVAPFSSSVAPSLSTIGATSTETTTTTIKPPKAIFDELTRGVLPPGADFEVIRQKSDGKLEEIGKTPLQTLPGKKVTFVVLEEQPDGSYKVQGVKGNGGEKDGGDLDSIVERIKNGELKLPPSSGNAANISGRNDARNLPTTMFGEGRNFTKGGTSKSAEFGSQSTASAIFVPTTTDKYESSASSVSSHVFNQFTPSAPKFTATRNYFIPTMAPVNEIIATTPTAAQTATAHRATESYSKILNAAAHGNFGRSENFAVPENTSEASINSRNLESTRDLGDSGNVGNYAKSLENLRNLEKASKTAAVESVGNYSKNSGASRDLENLEEATKTSVADLRNVKNIEASIDLRNVENLKEGAQKLQMATIANKGANNLVIREKTTLAPSMKNDINENLNGLLRKEGLFAMAKYLRQSGLDNVLNETGPYTIFVPTDKAFRTLLVQLGGPEKAEQKFKENPRLLSGLLLHHVIPGAFKISSLQDEMTGVSLAGTQLRVNDYAMHDHEWNDIKVTTINGAKVAPNKRDIEIPQGVAHAIDRVMFPLPVGDLVQTLQADRERRFTVFLKILTASGLQETLTGPKTFTVFAPMDAAFESAAKDETTVWTEEDGPEAAKTIISRHVIPSTLYTAGMRYYLQKDSLRPQSPVHIHKNGGRVRVNEAHVVTHNVPATNGVLHAIDAVL